MPVSSAHATSNACRLTIRKLTADRLPHAAEPMLLIQIPNRLCRAQVVCQCQYSRHRELDRSRACRKPACVPENTLQCSQLPLRVPPRSRQVWIHDITSASETSTATRSELLQALMGIRQLAYCSPRNVLVCTCISLNASRRGWDSLADPHTGGYPNASTAVPSLMHPLAL